MKRAVRAPRGRDVAVAGVLGTLAQLEVWSGDPAGPAPLVAALALAMAVPLAWRREYPGAVLGVALGAFLASEVVSGALSELVAPFATLLLAIYSAAANSPAQRAVVAGMLALAGVAVSVLLDEGGADADSAVYAAVVVAAAWAAGSAVRRRQARVSELQVETRRLERERDERARRAAEQERVRIARELHDVVTHNVSVMVVQAGAERAVLEDGQPRTSEVLETIEQAGRDTLVELRRLLGVLRAGDDVPTLRPAPGLGGLKDLVAQARSAGIDVDLAVEGDAAAVPAGVALSTHRIVQEALTNVLKHAPGARARVTVRCDAERLAVEVSDDGPGPDGRVAPGHGLIGMRERAALHRGTLEVGRSPHGGTRVEASLPLRE